MDGLIHLIEPNEERYVAMLISKRLMAVIFIFIFIFLAIQLFILDSFNAKGPEGWFSDIAYNLNIEFNGKMAKDIPYGATWSTGIGKLFFVIHHIFYKILGVGLFQARLITFISGIVLLILLYKWVCKYVSQEIAVLTIFLLASSPLFYFSLQNARQDVMHCAFAFAAFYLMTSAINEKKNIYYFLTGFISALSVDISYRGIIIVLTVYIYYLFFYEKGYFLKYFILLLSGSLVVFVYWISINIFAIGIDNFIRYNLAYTFNDGGPYQIKALLSEIYRFLHHFSGKGKYAYGIEVLYVIPLVVIFLKNRQKYKDTSKIIFFWLLITLFFMTIIEKHDYRAYLLLYYPFIFILGGIGLYELFRSQKKIAYIILVFILFFASGFHSVLFSKYVYHAYIKKDYDFIGYYKKLRASVDISKNIIGAPEHWYAFPDAQYYGGQFYLGRVSQVLNEIKSPKDYPDSKESATALLNVLKKRKIEYVIADESFKPNLVLFFTNNELPKKNFLLGNTIADNFMGESDQKNERQINDRQKKPPYLTEIYKIISYEP